ncbi:serine-rich adhesin for platelets-like isoform X2 [Penaeus japonicus]|uniref:serine-rich adhesin for platelets-like isoform X2 n=1 Tax=Penaeus japonicus TaxID=27405 RepID=UPI001C71476D|nr:serine-rich adhesin for platelets-like isoform X2 [Penaeus japonicus]
MCCAETCGKKVTFLVGMDGEPVVVVLGDGREEVDTILEERARRQAELEADLLKRAAEEELDKLVRLSRSTVQAMEEEAARNQQNKEHDPAREAVVRSLQEATVEMEKHIQAMEETDVPASKKISTSSISSNSSSSSSSPPSPASTTSSSGIGSLKLSSSASSSSLSSLSSNSSSASPPSPPAFSISSYGAGYGSSPRKVSGGPWETAAAPPAKAPLASTTSLPTVKPPILSPKPSLSSTLSFPSRISHTPASAATPSFSVPTTPTSTNGSHTPSPPSSLSSTTSSMSSSLTPSPPPSFSPPTLCPLTIVEQDDLCDRVNDGDAKAAMTVGVAAQIKRFEQLSEGSLEALKTATLERAKKRRQKEILEHLRSQVEAARQQVADTSTKQGSEKDDSAWQEQERKAKEAERRIREIARRAREEHRRASTHSSPAHAINRNLNGLTHNTVAKNTLIKNGVNGVNGHHSSVSGDINGNIKAVPEDVSNNNNNHNKGSGSSNSTAVSKSSQFGGCVRQRIRPPKPPSRGAIVAWFREEELPRGAGLEPSRTRVAPWFHGIISRTEAEEVLAGSEVGRFLVRVSERIWGYAISYRASDRCRHYLIDVTGGKYTFFGSHQASHDTLGDLIEYHKKEAITASGGELLTRPCGQSNPRKPDYLELFTGTQYLAL